MTSSAQRQEITRLCKRMHADGLGVGSAGNMSVRDGDRVLITPRGIDYDVLQPEMLCVIDLDGTPLQPDCTPSTDTSMHLAVYRGSDVGSVVHTHSRDAAAVGNVTDELPLVHYLMADLGGTVTVVPYGPTASPEVQERILGALDGRFAALLGNHGALTVGDTLDDAHRRAVYLEWVAGVYAVSRSLARPALLSDEHLKEVNQLLEGYFQEGRT